MMDSAGGLERAQMSGGHRLGVALAFLTLLAPPLLGCAGMGGGLGSMQKTAYLRAGMPQAEAHRLLGAPAEARATVEHVFWKYYLHEAWKGFVPYYLVFGARSQVLEHWYPHQQEYQQNQQALLQALQTATSGASQTSPPPDQPAEPEAPAKQSSPPSGSTTCESQHPTYEDRMCYCYRVCGTP